MKLLIGMHVVTKRKCICVSDTDVDADTDADRSISYITVYQILP